MGLPRHDVVNMQVFPRMAGLANSIETQFGLSETQPTGAVIPRHVVPPLDARLRGERIEGLDLVGHVVDMPVAHEKSAGGLPADEESKSCNGSARQSLLLIPESLNIPLHRISELLDLVFHKHF